MEVVDPGRRGTCHGFHRPGPGVVPDAQRVGLRAVDDLQDACAAQQLRRGVNGFVGEQREAESLSALLRTALTPGTRVRATGMAARVRTDGATIAAKLVLPRDAADRLRAVNTRRRCARHWPTVAHEPDPVRGCFPSRQARRSNGTFPRPSPSP